MIQKNLYQLLTCIIIICSLSCSKSSTDFQGPSKVDQLLTQLKQEPVFLDYLNTINTSMKIIAANVENVKPADSLVVKDKTLSYAELSKKLDFSGTDQLNDLYKKGAGNIAYLSDKYPAFATLTPDESKLMYKKAFDYYFKTNPKKK